MLILEHYVWLEGYKYDKLKIFHRSHKDKVDLWVW